MSVEAGPSPHMMAPPQEAASLPVAMPAVEQALSASDRLFLDHHDTVARDLLGPDYDFAVQSGLTDMFYLDPSRNEDGLLHTLTGDVLTGEGGTILPGGFHHEPSSRDGQTFVERDHLEGRNAKSMREYREDPFSPYSAHVVVEGFRKTKTTTNAETGESTVHPAKNGMYPKEYDALAVMQTVRNALANRDTSRDYIAGDTIITEGYAPMLDGQSQMRLRMCLDQETGKVISAYPMVARGSDKMKLDEDAIARHLGLK